MREQPTNQYRLTSMCRLVLGHAESSNSLPPQIYEVVAYRLSHQDDPNYRRALVRILTEECQRLGRVPTSMVPIVDRLKATSDEIRRLICARYEFLGFATAGEEQEFLRLLSANNGILGTTDVSEISGLKWQEAEQELLWSCVLTRLSPEDGKWWQRTSIAKTLTSWARTPDQRARIADRLVELLSLCADATALYKSDGLLVPQLPLGERDDLVLKRAGRGASPGHEPYLPDSGLRTSLGEFVRFVRTCDLPAAVLRDAHDILAAHAARAATVGERAALLECAGALLPDDAMTGADTEPALALLHAARTPDDGARSQRALLWFRPTIQNLLAVPTWPAPPTYDLLRAARRSATASDWYSLLQHLTDSGLLAATYQAHLPREDAEDEV